jgi:hypothetical protein
MSNRHPWGGIIYCFEDSGLFLGVQLRNMYASTALFTAGLQIMTKAGRVERRWMFELFDMAWGLRNADEHGVDLETQRMIRLAKCEGPFSVSIALASHFLRMKGIPLVNRWKICWPNLHLLRTAGSLGQKPT